MKPAEQTRQQFIQDFGDAYLRFGLPKLMGHVVALLLYHEGPLSLDEITEQLHVSKGPVSQVARRLRDNNLIQRVWVPGDRKDYYETVPDIFGHAFRNQMSLMKGNLELAQRYRERLEHSNGDLPEEFRRRVEEMERFYTLMMKHFVGFLAEWDEQRVHRGDESSI